MVRKCNIQFQKTDVDFWRTLEVLMITMELINVASFATFLLYFGVVIRKDISPNPKCHFSHPICVL